MLEIQVTLWKMFRDVLADCRAHSLSDHEIANTMVEVTHEWLASLLINDTGMEVK